MATVSLSAKARDTIGTGHARKLRQAGEVPAVIYGHSRDAHSLTLNARDLEKLLQQIAGTSTVVAPIRAANCRSPSGGIASSFAETRYHDGSDFQDGSPITSVNADEARGCCAA